jgi:hypothetical protein
MTIEDWLAAACADAERRGLADLKPLLASLADATRALRAGRWEDAGRAPADSRPCEAPAPPTDGGPQ